MRSCTWRVFASVLVVLAWALCSAYGQRPELDRLLEAARAAQAAGNYPAAAQAYIRATALMPDSAELWANRGIVEYLSEQYAASITSLKRALQLKPGLFAPLLFLGKNYIQQGRAEVALSYLNRAHGLRPEDVEALLGLGKAHELQGQSRQAASFYAQATRLAPDNANTWLALGGAYLEVITEDGRTLSSTARQSPWALALYADELLMQGRPVEAQETYRAVLSETAGSQKGTFLQMLAWMRDHPDLSPMPDNSRHALTNLLAQSGGNAQPAPACSHPASPAAAAACAYWAGVFQRSADEARKLRQQDSGSLEALYWLLKANEQLAVAALARFESLAPRSAASYDLVGDLYRDQRLFNNAASEYQKALAIDGRDPAALLGAAWTYFSLHDFEQAERIGRLALEDRPLDPQLNLLMAEVQGARYNFAQAKPYLDKCVSATPEMQLRVHYLLGRTALESGDKPEAIRQLEQALAGDKDGSMHYMLAQLYRQTGNAAAAQKTMEHAKLLALQRAAHAKTAVREVTAKEP